MSHSHKLSLKAAIMINLNIMVGIGLFLNTTILAQLAGAVGFVSYIALAVLLFPLIKSVATLVNIYPQGGFYTYASKQMHPLIGFVSAWSYFIGKLASAMLMIHSSLLLLAQIFPAIQQLNIFALDAGVLATFLALNLLHVQSGSMIQVLFLVMKLIPIGFVILSGIFLFSGQNYSPTHFEWGGFIDTLPLVLYSAVGFEATTSLSSKIKDAHTNGPRAILISYALVMCINVLYQLLFYGSLGIDLAQTGSFLGAFPLLITRLFGNHATFACTLQGLFNIAIACSALGGAYGILFSNSWNLHTLAQHNHIAFKQWFTRMNRYHIPFMCIAAEGFICLLHLALSAGNQIPLQHTTALGCSIAYTLSVLSLVLYQWRNNNTIVLSLFGLLNCLVLIGSSIYSIAQHGGSSIYAFASLLTLGVLMFFVTKEKE